MSGDRIELRGMRFRGRHGVLAAERAEPQPIEVDVMLWADLAPAAASDDLVDTVDYSTVFTEVAQIVEQRSFRLIEALAGAIATALLASQPLASAVEVRVMTTELAK